MINWLRCKVGFFLIRAGKKVHPKDLYVVEMPIYVSIPMPPIDDRGDSWVGCYRPGSAEGISDD